jgi:uncharacterized protein (DUF362 family)
MNDLFYSLNIVETDEIKTIGIKINLCDYRLPSSGATTDPDILKALLYNLRVRFPDSKIYIFENDASGTKVDNLFSFLNIDTIAKDFGCECRNLSKEKWINKNICGIAFDSVEVPEIMEQCDLIINHPKLKTHGMTKISVGLKNMFGCFHEKYKVIFHPFIDDAIVDINCAIRSDIIIVDGNICLEGIEGPTYGFPKKCGLLIGGKNIVSVDAFCSRLIGFNPKSVKHIKKANHKGLGDIKYELNYLDPGKFDYKQYYFNFDLVQYYLLKFFRGNL